MKRILKILIWIIVGLMIALFLVPLLFKGQLLDAVKKTVNEQINAKVEFADADLHLFKDFPRISLVIDSLDVTGVDYFEGEKLMTASEVYFSTDFKSVLKSDEGMTIYKIHLDEPVINLRVDKSGMANWDITKTEAAEESGRSSVFGNIERYEIIDGSLYYTDEAADMSIALQDVDHLGRGSFRDIIFDLKTQTKVNDLDVTYGKIPYLSNAVVDADVQLGIDLNKNSYTFQNNSVALNGIDLSFEGNTTLLDEGIDMDLSFKALNSNVTSVLSLIPTVYNDMYDGIESRGTGSLTGYVKGIYNSEKNQFPALGVDIDIVDGFVKYPDLPLPIKDILLATVIKARQGNWSDLVVDVSRFNFMVQDDPVSGALNISNIKNDPTIDGNIEGAIDLKNMSKAYPFTDIDMSSGKVDGRVRINATQSDIENKRYGNITLEGNAKVTDVDLEYDDRIDLKVSQATTAFSPRDIKTTITNGTLGNTDLNGSISITDPLKVMTDDPTLDMRYDLSSNRLDLDELMSLSAADTTTVTETAPTAYNINAQGKYAAEEVIYEDYTLSKLRTDANLTSNRLDISGANIKLDDSSLSLRGQLDNVMDYVMNDDTLTGNLYLDGTSINSNKYINESENTTEVEQVIPVPKNMKLDIYADIKSLIYDKYELKNIDGKINLEDGVASLIDGSAQLFNGQVNFEGTYNTFDIDKPVFDFKYDMSELKFEEMFENSSSFKILAPFAEYIDGVFNSTLVINGPLTKDMMPDLLKIDASGYMETLNGKIKDFKPLKVISESLGLESLKNFDLKDSKNWFEVKEGFVILKDHDYNVEDMIFTVGGRHSIDQKLDYLIKAKIPREKLNAAQLGKTLEMGMTKIEQEAKSRGVNISLGEFIYLDIFLTGSVTNPKVKIIPVGSGGKTLKEVVSDEVNKQVDNLKDTISEEVDKRTEVLKDTVNKVIQTKADSARAVVEEKVNEEKDKVLGKLGDSAKEKLDSTIAGGVVDSLKDKVDDKIGDILGNTGQSEVDSIKSKIKDWNIFKKKKKDN